MRTMAQDASVNAKSSGGKRANQTRNPSHLVMIGDDNVTTHCRGTTAVPRGMACTPSLYLPVHPLPTARVGTHARRLRKGLFAGAGSRGRCRRLCRGVRGWELSRRVRRRGGGRWFFGRCGRLWGRGGRDGGLKSGGLG